MNEDEDTGVRRPDPGPDLSFHGLSISPARPVAPQEPLPPPASGFTFLGELGRGGMGVVYEAREDATGRRVALKIIARRLGGSTEAVERFEREARLAASISHPNCVFVYGAHVIHGAAAISMELMSGRSLDDRLRAAEGVSVETAVGWAIEILDGLGAAHELGIVHRDVKPSNCFLTADGHVKVGDFGLSRSIEGDLGLTQSGAFLGSPLYASPEQVRGRGVDRRSDVYSAGATLYALLAGRPPHSGSSLGDVLAQIVSEAPPPLASLRPDLPRGLDDVVARALSKDAAKRFPDCGAFRRALLPFAAGSLTPATLGLRIGAYVVDSVIVSLIYQAVCFGLYLGGIRWEGETAEMAWVPMEGMIAFLIPTMLTLGWFALLEWRPGATPGKRLFGLRVVSMEGGRAALWRTVLRAMVFAAPYAIPTLLFGVETRPGMSVLRMLTYAVPMVTMRRSNAYRGFHEFASGTRVMRTARPAPGDAPAARILDPKRPPATGAPASIGPYAIEALIGPTAFGQIVTARDPALDRSVWIHLGGAAGTGGDTTRATCLRWLHGSLAPGSYDVYESPGGASLLEYAEAGRVFPWPEALVRILSLADELHARGTGVALEQVWIDRSGRLRVLDFAVGEGGAILLPVDAIATAAGLLLLGHPRPAEIPRDLPVHAEPAMRRLLGQGAPFMDTGEARMALHALAARPAVLTRARRAAQVALAAIWLAQMGLFVVISFRVAEAKAGDGLDAWKIGRMQAILAAVFLGAGVCVPSLLLAFVLRGGLTFSIFGIRLRNRAGALASRWRCLLRSVVVWSPLLPVLVVAPLSWYIEASYPLLGAAAAGGLILAAGAAFAVVSPTQGPADRLARTRLVRR